MEWLPVSNFTRQRIETEGAAQKRCTMQAVGPTETEIC